MAQTCSEILVVLSPRIGSWLWASPAVLSKRGNGHQFQERFHGVQYRPRGHATITRMRAIQRFCCLLGVLGFPSIVFAADCSALKQLKLADTTIATAERVTSGSVEGPGIDKPLHDLPAFCRVAGVLGPSPDSDIQFEVWLPEKDWRPLPGSGQWWVCRLDRIPEPGQQSTSRVCDGRLGCRPQGRRRRCQLVFAPPGEGEGFWLAGCSLDRTPRQGRDQGLLRGSRAEGLLRLMLRWRPRGADGGAALP